MQIAEKMKSDDQEIDEFDKIKKTMNENRFNLF